MDAQEIEKRVKGVLAEHLGIPSADIKPTASLVADLGCDSLDLIEIVMDLEDTFELNLDDDACEACSTVDDAVQLIAKSLAASAFERAVIVKAPV